jgi:hypothetical protein
MLCDYSADDLTCRACGHVAKRLPTYRECTATKIYLPRPALGDALAWLLKAVGITEARVSAWLGGGDCGCASRRKWLNRAGALAVDRVERWLNRLSRFALGG